MARKQRNNSLESRTARLKLAVRRRPYPGAKLARGKQMQYRRNKGNGTWLLKVSDGHGKPWTKAFAQADDFDESDNADDSDLLRGAGHCEEADARRGRRCRQRTDHGRRRADRLQSRPDLAQFQSLQCRLAARASHQRAAVKAGGIARGHRTEALARRSAGHDGRVDHQPAYALA